MSKTTNIQAALWRYRNSLNKKYNTEFTPRGNLRYMYLDSEGNVVEDMSKASWIVEISLKNIIQGSTIFRIHRYSDESVSVIAPSKRRSYEFIFIIGYCYAKLEFGEVA